MYNAIDNAVRTPAGSTVSYGRCDVCTLLDGDATPKQVQWCGLCQAWICEKDRHNWARRIQAFMRARKAGN